MGRVTVHVADSVLSALDEQAHNKSINRSQAVSEAIEFSISGSNQAILEAHNKLSEAHNKLSASEEEVMRLRQELSNINNRIAEKDKSLESSSTEIMRLKEDVKRIVMLQEEAEHNKDNYDELKSKYNQLVSENTSRWEETKTLKNENTKLKKDIDAGLTTIQRLQGELLNRQTDVDRIATLREELATAKTDRDRLQEALRSKKRI